MADTIAEVDIGIAGITGATIKLYPQGSDSIANGAGDSLTVETNRTGTYRATVTEALDGIHQAYCFDSNGVQFFNGLVDMADDTEVHHVEEHAAMAATLGTPAGASIAADVAALPTTELFGIVTGTAQAGAAGSITLAAGASAVNDFYAGAVVVIRSGTGALQTRRIDSYNGTTKVAIVDANWVTNPANDSVYAILGRIISE